METWNDENAIHDQARSLSGVNYILPRAIVLRASWDRSMLSIFVGFEAEFPLERYVRPFFLQVPFEILRAVRDDSPRKGIWPV